MMKDPMYRSLTFWLTTLCILIFFATLYSGIFVNFYLFFDVQTGVPFGAVKEGQIWRLFSPCFLHESLWHLLCNIGWLCLLVPQMEARMGRLRTLVLLLTIGAISNVAQYLIGGPFFEGLSGVLMGCVGFIAVRKNKAPTEGYPLGKGAILAACIFAFLGLGVEGIYALLRSVFLLNITFPIANTAHIVGGLTGCLLGFCPLFNKQLEPVPSRVMISINSTTHRRK